MKNNRNLFLSGGGDKRDSFLLDSLFASSLKNEKVLGYIPNATQSKPYEDCFAWFKSVFLPMGITSFVLMMDLKNPVLNNLGGLYIGGGNTSKLLTEMRWSGFNRVLKESISSGLPTYGGSAGAIVLGKTILTAPESRELKKHLCDGLDMLDGFSVYCHYDRRTDLSEISRQCGVNKFFAIPEKGGIHIVQNRLKVIGYDPIGVYSRGKSFFLNPGESTTSPFS